MAVSAISAFGLVLVSVLLIFIKKYRICEIMNCIVTFSSSLYYWVRMVIGYFVHLIKTEVFCLLSDKLYT